MIYLDNAATSFPKPQSVINSMMKAQRDIGANPGRGGHRAAVKAGEIVYSLREELAEMFGGDAEKTAFTLNCTHALNTAIKGTVAEGDHIIISSLEHNSVLRPVHALAEKGVTYSVARVNPFDKGDTLRAFEALIKPNTKAVVCTAVSNVFGTVLPIEKIGNLCRTRGLTFIVDAAQAAGTMKINMEKMKIDILCMPGHKGLFGPMGTGIIMLGKKAEVSSLVQGGTGSLSLDVNQPQFYPDKLESGTVNLPGLAGLLSGIRFIGNMGTEKAMAQKEKYLCDILYEDLKAVKGIRIYDEVKGKSGAPLISVNVGNLHSEETAMLLDERGIAVRSGYHCSYLAHKTYGTTEKGVVRISPGYFTTKKDVKTLVFYLNKIAKGQFL